MNSRVSTTPKKNWKTASGTYIWGQNHHNYKTQKTVAKPTLRTVQTALTRNILNSVKSKISLKNKLQSRIGPGGKGGFLIQSGANTLRSRGGHVQRKRPIGALVTIPPAPSRFTTPQKLIGGSRVTHKQQHWTEVCDVRSQLQTGFARTLGILQPSAALNGCFSTNSPGLR